MDRRCAGSVSLPSQRETRLKRTRKALCPALQLNPAALSQRRSRTAPGVLLTLATLMTARQRARRGPPGRQNGLPRRGTAAGPACPQRRFRGNVADPSELRFGRARASGDNRVAFIHGINCQPCGDGRTPLVARGIPFVERSVIANTDIGLLNGDGVGFAADGGRRGRWPPSIRHRAHCRPTTQYSPQITPA